ncbi:MAG: hypothetical protein K2I73_04325, partial [Eubacterium sp.]|nr:hypothetical protein [Eubacterium sp.]
TDPAPTDIYTRKSGGSVRCVYEPVAKDCGFDSPYAMADKISAMKKRMGMKSRLSEIGCTTEEQILELTEKSMSMLMERNPIALTKENIYEMYKNLK